MSTAAEPPITDSALTPAPSRARHLADHELQTIADLMVAGRSFDRIAKITGISEKRLKKLASKKSKNQKFVEMLRVGRYHAEVAGVSLMRDLTSPDMLEMCTSAVRRALLSRNEALAYEAAKDIYSLSGVIFPRDQKGPQMAMQLNVGGQMAGISEDAMRQHKALTSGFTSVMKTVNELAASLPAMDENPHITKTGVGPQLGDEAITDGIIDVESKPIEDATSE